MFDVLAQELASGFIISLSAKFENRVMLLVGPIHAVCKVQLETGVAFTAVVDIADNCQASSVRRGIEIRAPIFAMASCRSKIPRWPLP
jgi:hypothetical protein